MKASFLVKSFAGAAAMIAMAGPALAAAPAVAPASVSVESEILIERTVVVDGKSTVKLLALKNVVPGDRLLFRFKYHNSGAVPATNYVMVDPLPPAAALAPEGVKGADVSVDGGKTWGMLDTLKVSDGQGGTRAAQASDVTHVRLTVAQIAPGATGQFEFHAIVR
jgi:uncharacterized repeat protein (TIGR01451 family)